MKSFKLHLKLRLDWSDLDMYRHVNNISFMRFMQSGRVMLWEATGLHKMHAEEGKGAMLVATSCDFKKSLYYPGNAVVKTRVSSLGNKSFSLEHHITDDNGDLCAIGKDTVVFFDFKAETSLSLYPELRRTLEEFS